MRWAVQNKRKGIRRRTIARLKSKGRWLSQSIPYRSPASARAQIFQHLEIPDAWPPASHLSTTTKCILHAKSTPRASDESIGSAQSLKDHRGDDTRTDANGAFSIGGARPCRRFETTALAISGRPGGGWRCVVNVADLTLLFQIQIARRRC